MAWSSMVTAIIGFIIMKMRFFVSACAGSANAAICNQFFVPDPRHGESRIKSYIGLLRSLPEV